MKKVRLITIEQLLEMMINEEPFKLVEVLHEEQYKAGHLPGAISIPLGQLQEKAEKVLSIKEIIVVYCSGYTCHASTNATKILLDMGYENVLDYKGSKRGWVEAGFELEE